MKVTAMLIAIAMVGMMLEGCDSQTGYDARELKSALGNGLARANEAFIEGFADRPAQSITVGYKPPTPTRPDTVDDRTQTN